MKALSIRQPWAWAVVGGLKPIENRTWATPYRGPLLIHAPLAMATIRRRDLPELPREIMLPFGAIVGVAELVDCVPLDACRRERFAEGPWCWLLRDARAFEPIPYRGAMGLFDVPDEIVRDLL